MANTWQSNPVYDADDTFSKGWKDALKDYKKVLNEDMCGQLNLGKTYGELADHEKRLDECYRSSFAFALPPNSVNQYYDKGYKRGLDVILVTTEFAMITDDSHGTIVNLTMTWVLERCMAMKGRRDAEAAAKVNDVKVNDVKVNDVKVNDVKVNDVKVNDVKVNDVKTKRASALVTMLEIAGTTVHILTGCFRVCA
jgi:hypothetical protein